MFVQLFRRTMSEVEECIRILLATTEPAPVHSIVSQAHIPHDQQGRIGRLVLLSPLVYSTPNGKIQHVWAAHARNLLASAKDETRVFEWAVAAATPAPINFVTYVMDNVDNLKLHSRWYGVVREQTALNVYNRAGLIDCIKQAAEVGLNRENIMAEYDLAFVDFHKLIRDKTIFATNDRAWHV
jgi:hypothetical protein